MAFMVRLSPISSVHPRRAPGHRFEENWSLDVLGPQWALLALIAVGLILSGCQKPDEITRYTVAKPPPREGKPAVSSSVPENHAAASDAGDGPSQLLGAVIPHGKMTWFFKLTGPSEAVDAQMKPFALFLGSIKFSDKGPDWALPEGWEEEPGSKMRFATIRIAAPEGPLEMSVIPLPTGEGSFDAYLLSNVNRWRGQFGLAPINPDELDAHVHKIELAETIWLVKFEGRMAQSDMGATGPAAKAAPRREPKAAAPDHAAPDGGAGWSIPDCSL
jgi:hypothetical protein